MYWCHSKCFQPGLNPEKLAVLIKLRVHLIWLAFAMTSGRESGRGRKLAKVIKRHVNITLLRPWPEAHQMDFIPVEMNYPDKQNPLSHVRLLHQVIKLNCLFLFYLRDPKITYCAFKYSYKTPDPHRQMRFLSKLTEGWHRGTSTYTFLSMYAALLWCVVRFNFTGSAQPHSTLCCFVWAVGVACRGLWKVNHTALTQGKRHQPHLTSSHCRHLFCPSKVTGWINIVWKPAEKSTVRSLLPKSCSELEESTWQHWEKFPLQCLSRNLLSLKSIWVYMEGRESDKMQIRHCRKISSHDKLYFITRPKKMRRFQLFVWHLLPPCTTAPTHAQECDCNTG